MGPWITGSWDLGVMGPLDHGELGSCGLGVTSLVVSEPYDHGAMGSLCHKLFGSQGLQLVGPWGQGAFGSPVDPIASQIEDNNDQRLLDPKEDLSILTGLSITRA